jgi:hypothetical protein
VLPADAGGSHGGLWHAVLKLGRTVTGLSVPVGPPQNYPGYYNPGHAVLPYELIVQTYSSLSFTAYATQASYDVGAVTHVTGVLKEYDAPLRQQAGVWAEIRRPDGVTDVVLFDEEAEGRFLMDYALGVPGVYVMRVRARGETTRGSAFERERTLTAVAVPAGDMWSPDEPKTDEVCELLECIRGSGVLTVELAGRLRSYGIDVDELLNCIEERCPSIADEFEVRRPEKPGAVTVLQAGGVPLDRLVDMVVTRLEERLRGAE